MTNAFQQVLAALRPEEVSFILSQLPAEKQDGETDSQITAGEASTGFRTGDEPESDLDAENRRRRRIDREWPAVGTILSAEYYGEHYRAEIIPAGKKLKSGRQIRLCSGPGAGMVCDSFSEAMLCATEIQRNEQGLGRKGTSNGWIFWQWEGKPENIAGTDSDDAD